MFRVSLGFLFSIIVMQPQNNHETTRVLHLSIGGMTCHACEIRIERRLKKMSGIIKTDVNAAASRARIVCRANEVPDLTVLKEALAQDGYTVEGWVDKAGKEIVKRAESRPRPTFWQLVGLFALVFILWRVFSSLDMASWLGTSTAKGTSFAAALVLGLVAGTSSCLAVAGGLLLSSLASVRERYGHLSRAAAMWPVSLFIGGRLVSYTVLGGFVGLLGKALTPSPLLTGLFMAIAAFYMIIMGLDMLSLAPAWLKTLLPRMPKSLGHKILDAEGRKNGFMPFLLGAATFFLPCGFTQSLQLYALTTGSFYTSAMILGGFALGTVPALAALGIASTSLKGNAAHWFFRFTGALVMVLGFFNFQNGLAVAGYPLSLPSFDFSRSATPTAIDTSVPPIVDGKQVIQMAVGSTYVPNRLTVRAGVPVRWEIDGSGAVGCAASLQSPALGIRARALSRGVNIVEFTPAKKGDYTFSCSMGMVRGTMHVVS